MADAGASAVSVRRAWAAKATSVATGLSLVSLIAAWVCAARANQSSRVVMALAGLAAALAAAAYAAGMRPRPGRLPGFGRGKVLVRSLDDWTQYQYGVPFDGASAEQQSQALDNYKVGDRLFPARAQDAPRKTGPMQRLMLLVTFCSFITLSEVMRGWQRLWLFLAFYAWLALCMWLSKKFAGAAKNDLVSLEQP